MFRFTFRYFQLSKNKPQNDFKNKTNFGKSSKTSSDPKIVAGVLASHKLF